MIRIAVKQQQIHARTDCMPLTYNVDCVVKKFISTLKKTMHLLYRQINPIYESHCVIK